MTAPRSARGLFRAMGKQSMHVVKTGEGYKRSGKIDREPNDFYPTPPEVTRAFLAVEGARLAQIGSVWEPAAGDGAMVRELIAYGLRVTASDLIDRGCGAEIRNFYSYNHSLAPAIVTNPPYCQVNARYGKGRWLTHGLGLPGVEYVALFLNWDWPAAAGLAGILARHQISRVYVCRWKVDFTGKGAPPQRNAWFIWDREHSGETVMRFLDRRDGQQRSLLDMEAEQ